MDDFIRRVLGKIPLHKLDKYQATNITLDIIALYLTLQFTLRKSNELAMTITWIYVVTLCFACVFWASKQ
jgi:hypothetical protein